MKGFMKDSYDIAVIGGGIGGLTAGALLAHKGFSVAVFEVKKKPGGYCTSFKRGEYRFDSALDAVSGCGEHGWLRRVLDQHLGVMDQVEFVRLDPLRVDLFGNERVEIPAGLPALMDLLYGIAPGEREGILGLMQAMEEIFRTAMATPPDTLYNDPRMEKRGGALARFRRASFAQMLDEYVNDAKLRAVLCDRCAYMGLPPSRVSAIAMTIMYMTYAQGGGYRIKGGAQSLADAFVKGLVKHGGEFINKTRISKIHIEDGRAAGVEVDGTLVRTKAVVSAADAVSTASMAGLDAEQDGLRPSVSYFMVYLGLDGRLDMPDGMGVYPGYDIELTFSDISSDIASPGSSMEIINYSNISPSMAPDGCTSMMLMAKAAYSYAEDWKACKAAVTDRLIAKADMVFPGLKGMISVVDSGTPLTLERYTGNTQGAAFGWEQDVDNRRSAARTRIPGLFQAGHWTYPGGGVESVTASGIIAAELAAAFASNKDVV
jgi:phytoene dehydrogenase-like protein